jgi:hypothetical protein
MNPLLLPRGRPREGAGGGYVPVHRENAYTLRLCPNAKEDR